MHAALAALCVGGGLPYPPFANGVRTMRTHALVLVASVCMWVGLPAYGYAQ